MNNKPNIFKEIKKRVLILDGAICTVIQRHNLIEKTIR